MSGRRLSRKRRRRLLRRFLAAEAVILGGALLFAALGCRATSIQIIGNYHETDDEIRDILGRNPFAENSVYLFLFNQNRKIPGDTFVDTLSVDPDGRNAVTVRVKEKKLIGCVMYNDKYWYFNRSGVILVSSDKGEEKASAGIIRAADEKSAGASYIYPGFHAVTLMAENADYEDEEYYEEEESDGMTEEADENEAEADMEQADSQPDDDEEADSTDSEEDEENEENNEDDGETDDIVIEPVIIEPSIIPGNPAEKPEKKEHQTWEIDTSAKGGNYLPCVEGLEFSEAALGCPLPVQFDRVFSSIAVLKSFVDRSGYVPDSVRFEKNGDLIVTYENAAVNLGAGENIEQRISVMGEALPSFIGLTGTLHLENYDGAQKRLIFSKNEKTS